MIYYRKSIIHRDENNISFILSLSTDDTIDINDFYNKTDKIFDVDGDIIKLADEIYNNCPDEYKKYDISIDVCQNYIFGYKKEYSKNNTTVTIIKDNGEPKGAIIADGMTTEVYNIKNIPNDIKQIICGSAPINTPVAQPTNINPDIDSQNNKIDDSSIRNIPDIDIPNDVNPNAELGIKAENMINQNIDNDKNNIDQSIDNIQNNTESDMKKLDISKSVAFNNLFDRTLSMMDNIGPSPELVSELHNPDATVSNKIKNFFGKKLI